MNTFCVAMLFSIAAIADESTDRTAIDRTIARLNERLADPDAGPISNLFTKDIDPAERDALINLHRQLREAAARPWSEMSPPAIVRRATRFVTENVALVDAAESQVTVGSAGIPLLFVMKRRGEDWAITSVRVLGSWPRAVPWIVNVN